MIICRVFQEVLPPLLVSAYAGDPPVDPALAQRQRSLKGTKHILVETFDHVLFHLLPYVLWKRPEPLAKLVKYFVNALLVGFGHGVIPWAEGKLTELPVHGEFVNPRKFTCSFSPSTCWL